jgi:anti-anti-sigma factor
MEVQVKTLNNHVVVAIEGRLDTTQSDAFEKKMLEILQSGADKIILDCERLEYISSSGLRVFLIMQKKMNVSGGQMKICNLQPIIKEIFEVSGFMMIFSVYPDVDASLKA